MEGIEHRTETVNGLNMHIAEKGQGPLVLLLHGFPELWYSWRHQILHLAAHGYRAVAPDLRGFGDTTGWRPPKMTTVEVLRAFYGDDHYVCRFQVPGEIEAELATVGTRVALTKFFTYRNPSPWYFPKGKGFAHMPDTPVVLPPWLAEEDVDYYLSKFEKTGFTGGLNYYRAWDLSWELNAPWCRAKVKVPTKFIVGDLDFVYHGPGMKEYVHSGEFHKDVPLLEEVVVMEGVAHFINQEKPDEVNKHILDFLKEF